MQLPSLPPWRETQPEKQRHLGLDRTDRTDCFADTRHVGTEWRHGSFAPRLEASCVIPAGNWILQAALNPKKSAVHAGGIVTHQGGNKVGSFLWIVSAGGFYPFSPLPIGLCEWTEMPRGVLDISPHVGLHVAGVDHVGGHPSAVQFGGQMACELDSAPPCWWRRRYWRGRVCAEQRLR